RRLRGRRRSLRPASRGLRVGDLAGGRGRHLPASGVGGVRGGLHARGGLHCPICLGPDRLAPGRGVGGAGRAGDVPGPGPGGRGGLGSPLPAHPLLAGLRRPLPRPCALEERRARVRGASSLHRRLPGGGLGPLLEQGHQQLNGCWRCLAPPLTLDHAGVVQWRTPVARVTGRTVGFARRIGAGTRSVAVGPASLLLAILVGTWLGHALEYVRVWGTGGFEGVVSRSLHAYMGPVGLVLLLAGVVATASTSLLAEQLQL